MKDYMHSLGLELEDYHIRNTDLEAAAKEMIKKLDFIKMADDEERTRDFEARKMITSLKIDLDHCMDAFQDEPAELQVLKYLI
jgi:hypothetical protein